MAIKTLTGTYASGYTLSAGYSGLTIAASAKVSGVAGAVGQSSTISNGGVGGVGGVGILVNGAISVNSGGAVSGGKGGAGGSGGQQGGAGGIGGVGLELAVGGSVIVAGGTIVGGMGGAGGASTASRPGIGGQGGAGGAGILLIGGGSVSVNGGTVIGGQGGVGGYGYFDTPSGQGGAGLSLMGGGSFALTAGTVIGGEIGPLGPTSPQGYQDIRVGGGAGVYVGVGGTFTNSGTVVGGASSKPQSSWQGPGVVLNGATLINGSAADLSALISGEVEVNSGPSYLPSTVLNFATIKTSNGGIVAQVPGDVIVNGGTADHTALIYGRFGGLVAGSAVTVTNFGSIAVGVAGDCMNISGYGSRLVAEAGSSFKGRVTGYRATLELAGGSGAITGLGGEAFISGAVMATVAWFAAYDLDAGGSWTFSGSNGLAATQTLNVAGATTWNNSAGSRVQLRGGVNVASTGSIKVVGKSALVLAQTSVVNDGVIAATGLGVIVNGATLNNAGGGTVFTGPGSKVVFEGADIIGGTFSTTGSGIIEFANAPSVLDGSTSTVTNKARMVLFNGATVNAAGVIAGSGQIVFAGSSKQTEVVIAAAGLTLSGGGVVSLGNSSQDVIIGASSAATLTNVSDKIEGGGRLGGGQLTLLNQAAGIIEGTGAIGLTIDTGANTIMNAGLIWAAGHAVTVNSALASTGKLYAMRGVLTLAGPVTGSGLAYINGGTLIAQGAFSQNVVFNGTSGVLELGQSQAYGGQIVGFSTSGKTTLDLLDIAFTGAGEASFSGAGNRGVLTVSDGTHTAHITLAGNFLASTFVAASDGHGGVSITASSTQVFNAAMAGIACAPGALVQPMDGALAAAQPLLARPG